MKGAELRSEARRVREAAPAFSPELARLMLELADEIDAEAAAEEAKALLNSSPIGSAGPLENSGG